MHKKIICWGYKWMVKLYMLQNKNTNNGEVCWSNRRKLEIKIIQFI